jgi:hypothetical protein
MNTHLVQRIICAPFVWIIDYAKATRAHHHKSKQQYENKGEVSLTADI